MNNPIFLLRLEGATLFALSIFLFSRTGISFWWFAGILLPDVSMLGYLLNPKIGAKIYNLFHIYFAPAFVVVLGLLLSNPSLIAVGIIWFAHIGMDRMLGYGLKLQSGFKDTHLGKIGQV